MTWVAAALVVTTLAAMASGRVDPIVALLAALVLGAVLDLAPPAELASGLSNAGVITVAAMLVIAKGIVQTGLVARATWALLSSAASARQAFRRLAGPIGIASALINTTPLVALLIPATRQLEQTKRIPARELLLPMAHVTTLLGSVTLIGTSSNLVIAGIASQRGVEMSMLSFAPVALPVALVGTVMIYLTALRILRGTPVTVTKEKEWRVEIPVTAPAGAENRRAAKLGIFRTQEYELVGIQRWGEPIDPDARIEAGDLLVFAATEEGVAAIWRTPLFGMSAHRLYAVSVAAGEHGTLHDFEQDGKLRIIAARSSLPLHETELVPGETCFVSGPSAEAVAASSSVALWQDAASRAPQPAKTGIALAVLLCVIVGLVPAEVAATGGALLMVLTGVISPRSAARALEPKVLGILAGSIGLGAIVVGSGLAEVLAEAISDLSDGPLALVIVLAVVTTVMTNLVTNAATASIVTPVAITVAAEMGLDPQLVLALVGTCVSFTLLNPFSHQSNVMVMQPGGYTGALFARVGAPLLATCLLTVCGVAYLQLS
jgi:di/tricarboxylate transporter